MNGLLKGLVVGLWMVSSAFAEEGLYDRALSVDAGTAAVAREELRAIGPKALMGLLRHPVVETEAFRATQSPLALSIVDVPEPNRAILDAVDAVAGQKDAAFSKLYWFTDWEAARAEALESGRPILTLRLLGKLTSDLSCANSRFFRKVLYSEPEVADYLRDHFVLYWQTVREVPVMTVDFGDGRTIRRTITGNSVHYVMDEKGRVTDALPGLYDPHTFVAKLQAAEALFQEVKNMEDEPFSARLAAWHGEREAQLLVELKAAGWEEPEQLYRDSEVDVLSRKVSNTLAQNLGYEFQFSPAVSAILARHMQANPTALTAGALAITKSEAETPGLRAMRVLHENVGRDTLQNEYVLHRNVHKTFKTNTTPIHAERMNDYVYANLFLMPLYDPWLGLAPADAFSALDNEGLIVEGAGN